LDHNASRFHEAAAEVYKRLVALKDNADASIDDVVRVVLRENRDSSETREAMR
jgi:predicted CopG family antitoxin